MPLMLVTPGSEVVKGGEMRPRTGLLAGKVGATGCGGLVGDGGVMEEPV